MITKIKDFPNYGVDTDGNVYSLERRIYRRYAPTTILKPRPNNKGYLVVHLYNEYGMCDKLVHRIVAETFIPNIENKPEVNHIDGNKNNNSVDNLEWVTHTENVQNAIKRGTAYQNLSGNINPRCKKICQYNLDGNLIKIWPSTRAPEYELGFGHQNIIRAIKNNSIIYGFKWKYYEGVETN